MNRPMKTLGLFALAAIVWQVTPAHADEAEKEAKKVTYVDHVQPIFREHCFSCHNRDDATNDLALDSYSAVMAGGAGGAAIEPGDPDSSRIYLLMSHQEAPEMPPEQDKLPEEQLAVIREWIAGGVLENTGSKAIITNKPKVDLAMTSGSGKPEGEVAMPQGLSRQPAVYTERPGAITAMTSSPWAPLLAVSGQKQILLYNSDSAELIGVLPFPEGMAHVLKFSRSGSLLLAGGGHASYSGKVVVFDVKTGERVFEVGDELDTVLAADINEDHTQIALGGPSRVVRIYSTTDGSVLHEIRKHTEWIYALEFSPDGVLLATADRNGGMFVWESETAREYLSLKGHSAAITDVSWRLDSNVLASSSEDGTVRLWEMNGGKQIKSWGAHGGGTLSVRYTHDGRLVTAGRDKTVKTWDGAGAAQRTFEAFDDIALEATFSHDGARVLGGDWSGELRLWSAADGALVATLPGNPPTLEMQLAQSQSAAEAAATQQQQTAAQLAAAEKQLAEVITKATQAATEATNTAQAAAQTATQLETANQLTAEKTTLSEQAAAQLAAAMAALEKAKAELAAAQKSVTDLAAQSKTAAEKAAAAKAAADKLAADKATVEQQVAAMRTAAEQAAAKANQAQQAKVAAQAELDAENARQQAATQEQSGEST